MSAAIRALAGAINMALNDNFKYVKRVKDGILIEVKAKPGSPYPKLYFKEGRLILELQSPPEDNKANKEAIKYLGDLFSCEVEIAYGYKTSHKGFLIKASGDKVESVVNRLCS